MHERIEKIKIHLSDNKDRYIAGASCLVVGAVGTLALTQRVAVSQQAKNIALLIWKPIINQEQITVVNLAARGQRGHGIWCNETRTLYGSIRETGRAMNINPGNISAHLSGKNEHAGGYTFQDLGENLSEKVNLSV